MNFKLYIYWFNHSTAETIGGTCFLWVFYISYQSHQLISSVDLISWSHQLTKTKKKVNFKVHVHTHTWPSPSAITPSNALKKKNFYSWLYSAQQMQIVLLWRNYDDVVSRQLSRHQNLFGWKLCRDMQNLRDIEFRNKSNWSHIIAGEPHLALPKTC